MIILIAYIICTKSLNEHFVDNCFIFVHLLHFLETPLEDNPVQTPTELEEIEGEVESSDPEEEEVC